MDMTANDGVDAALSRRLRNGVLEAADVLDRRLGLVLQVRRERPVRQIDLAPHPVDVGIRRQQHVIDIAAQFREPRTALHYAVEFVAVQYQHAPAVGALMDVLAMNLEIAEHGAVEFAKYLIMVA